jgi:hypothetical protein
MMPTSSQRLLEALRSVKYDNEICMVIGWSLAYTWLLL